MHRLKPMKSVMKTNVGAIASNEVGGQLLENALKLLWAQFLEIHKSQMNYCKPKYFSDLNNSYNSDSKKTLQFCSLTSIQARRKSLKVLGVIIKYPADLSKMLQYFVH